MADLTVATAELNVEVNPGEPLELTVPILDGDRAQVTVAVPEDWSALAHARQDWRATSTLHVWTTAGVSPNAEITTDGEVVLTATAAQTAAWQTAWTAQTADWDLFVTDNTGVQHCIVAGQIRLVPRVTRSA